MDIEADPYDLSDDQSDAVTAIADRDALARAYDPEAFEDHPIERRSHVAAIQWAARRKLALDAADRLMVQMPVLGWVKARILVGKD